MYEGTPVLLFVFLFGELLSVLIYAAISYFVLGSLSRLSSQARPNNSFNRSAIELVFHRQLWCYSQILSAQLIRVLCYSVTRWHKLFT